MPTRTHLIAGLILGAGAIGLAVRFGLLDPTSILGGLAELLLVLYPIVLLVLFVLLSHRLLSTLE